MKATDEVLTVMKELHEFACSQADYYLGSRLYEDVERVLREIERIAEGKGDER